MEGLDEIVFETIDAVYARGRYGPFSVIMRRADSYINATKLAALGGKRLDNWLANKGSKELIEAVTDRLAASPGIPGDGVARATATVTGGANPEVRGTYIHPLLVPHVASWASTDFAIKASEIVNAALAREYRDALRAKDDKIDRLETMLARIQAATEHTGMQIEGLTTVVDGVRRQNDALTVEVGGVRKQNEALATEVRIVRDQNELLADSATQVLAAVNEIQDLALATAQDAVSRPEDPGKEERFALLAATDELGERRLYVVRGQARALASQVAARRRQTQDKARRRARQEAQVRNLDESKSQRLENLAASRVRVSTVFALSYVPNARHLWTRIQEEAGSHVKTAPGSPASVVLVDMTEGEFEALARRLHNEPQAQCRAATSVVQRAAAQTIHVAVGPVYVTNLQVLAVSVASAPKLSDEDFDELLADVV